MRASYIGPEITPLSHTLLDDKRGRYNKGKDCLGPIMPMQQTLSCLLAYKRKWSLLTTSKVLINIENISENLDIFIGQSTTCINQRLVPH